MAHTAIPVVIVQQKFGVAADGGQGCTEFVGYIGYELVLALLERGQFVATGFREKDEIFYVAGKFTHFVETALRRHLHRLVARLVLPDETGQITEWLRNEVGDHETQEKRHASDRHDEKEHEGARVEGDDGDHAEYRAGKHHEKSREKGYVRR